LSEGSQTKKKYILWFHFHEFLKMVKNGDRRQINGCLGLIGEIQRAQEYSA
jgi:hypothetical protein